MGGVDQWEGLMWVGRGLVIGGPGKGEETGSGRGLPMGGTDGGE